MELILASKSPRRRELLSLLGLPFKTITEDIDETINIDIPVEDEIKRLSFEKANAVKNAFADDVIIAADTVVVLQSRVFGKPRDAADAKKMLSTLSGKTHKVITGVTVMAGERYDTRAATTLVTFRDLSEAEIDAYIRTGDPLDKAGAYALQGRSTIFVKSISGDHFNVYGLPVGMLADMLRSFGVEILGEKSEENNA